MRMTILYLTSNPRAYKLFLAELDEAAARGAMSSPIQMAEARQLPYLQAVVREGMRIYPGGTPLAFKTVPPGGDEISGYRLPAGTQVGMNVWGALRSKEFWGDDADLFRPERWLGVAESRLAAMTECLDFQFGYGRYQCLGRPVVFMELNKAIPEVKKYSFRFNSQECVADNSKAPQAVRVHRCKPGAPGKNQECWFLFDARLQCSCQRKRESFGHQLKESSF